MYGKIPMDIIEGCGHFPKAACLLVVLLFTVILAGTVATAEQRHHESHVHGIGKLNVALDDDDLMIELDSPAANIVGFEHAPENEEQEHILHEQRELLEAGHKLFVLPAEGKCTLRDVQLIDGMGGHHDEHETHGHDGGMEHSDFEVTYLFTCVASQHVDSINVRLFEYFPGFEEIEVQLIAPGKQTAVELTPKNHQISF